MHLLGIVERPGVSCGVLGCPGVIRLTALFITSLHFFRRSSKMYTTEFIPVYKRHIKTCTVFTGTGITITYLRTSIPNNQLSASDQLTYHSLSYFSLDATNLSSGFPTRSDKNQAVQPQKIARGLKFWI